MPGSTGRSPKNYHMSIVPMSERQQMKLVRQLETCDGSGGEFILLINFKKNLV